MWNDLCLVGVGKIAPKFRAAKSVKAITLFWMRDKSFKGRDRTFVSDWLKKRGLQKL